jgi:hypothetical protein
MKYDVPDWITGLTEQRNKSSGCIPWTYEWMLRVKGATVDFTDFQERYDLKGSGKGDNNFSTVASAISKDYSNVCIESKSFLKEQGKDKIDFLHAQATSGRLCAYSLAFEREGILLGWHIMPVISIDEDSVTMVFSFDEKIREPKLLPFKRSYLIDVHQRLPGGDDTAWLERF